MIERVSNSLINRSGPIGQILTHTRRESPPDYKFPLLITDARRAHYVRRHGENMSAYLKPVAGPYTVKGVHLMVIPDSLPADPKKPDKRKDIPGITDLSSGDLGIVLQMGADTAESILNTMPNVGHVDVGLHYHQKDPYKSEDPNDKRPKLKQRLNTFPDTMHLHVIGYDSEEIQPRKPEDIIKDPDLLGRTGDAIHTITEEIFEHEIIGKTFGEDDGFDNLFERTTDARGRLRFKMLQGKEGFKNPELPRVLQTIDRRAKELYDELGKCFFMYDDDSQQFVEDSDDHGRYKLLPLEDRTTRLDAYIEERSDWLSKGSQRGLRHLAKNAITAQQVLDREKDKGQSGVDKLDHRSHTGDQIAANRFWTHKGLAYTMVWSAQWGDQGEIDWVFGFDTPVFSVEGIPQSSPIMDKIITKQEGAVTEQTLRGMRARETQIVLTLLDHYGYQLGTKIPDNV